MAMRTRTDARTLDPQRVAQMVEPVFSAWPIQRAWLFGSVARGTQHERSDVDLIIEPDENAGIGFGIVTIQDQLEEALGLDVDVHSLPDPKRSNPAFIRTYEASTVMVYERTTG